MGEVKSVKVDNWGVFFLQKLQNFFNKTDYCDLTLQFRDNSQLKVHRLVLSACTDYFNVLEQTCEIVDDALIMPNEFQADVVVPIVNFMYTGTLEFELKMYGKLLRTAKEMNMTVLLKLLEAHRRTMENVNRQQRPPSPKGIRRRPVGPAGNVAVPHQRAAMPATQARSTTPLYSPVVGAANMLRPNTQRATGNALLRTGTGVNSRTQYITSSTEASTSSIHNTVVKQEPQSTSPFEQLRKGYNNNKRPAQTSLISPPSKKPSLEDVKEFAEQQRMRKQIAAEYGEQDQDYEGMLYDDVHTGDDDDDDMPPQPSTSKQQQQQQMTAQSGTQTTQLEHGTTTIILKQDSPSETPTIIVKDSSNTKLNHTKIIAEVLRQYPHIVRGHKNIKLKIMPNTPTSAEKPAVASAAKRGSPVPAGSAQQSGATSPHKKLHVSFKSDKSTPLITAPQKTLLRETTTAQKLPTARPVQASAPQAAAGSSAAASAATTGAPQKRRIDSKTMHALIAQGAENTTGPWLCLRCGVNGRPISIPSYRGFRRHLINTHKETIDPALCEHCGWRSSNNRELHFHMYKEHQIKSLLYTYAECALCNQSYLTKAELEQHINEAHTDENTQQCIYCNKVFAQELQLYRHMKSYHKAQALEDGIIDETDEEYVVSQDEDDEQQLADDEQAEQQGDEKVRILSDISLPTSSTISQEQLQLNTSNEQEVKFVGADGNEVELTEEQRKEILSQLNQQQAGATSGGVVMVLSEPDGDEKQESDEKSTAGTEEEEYDDTQIYSELATDNSKKNEVCGAGVADDSKESIDNLEWAENLISEQELEAEQSNKEQKAVHRRDDISEKLKELTGDWTEDENEEDDSKSAAPTKEDAATDSGKPEEQTATVDEATNEQVAAEAVEEPPQEEDDIDLALQSLHKEDEETDAVADTAAVATEQAANSSNTNSETVAPPVDQMKADEDDATAAEGDANDADAAAKNLLTIKKEDDAEEEFIAETAPDKLSAEANSANNSVDDVHLETENIRKELLDELIAEAEKPAPDDDLVPATQLLPADEIDVAEAAKAEIDNVPVLADKATDQQSPENNKKSNDEKPNTSESANSTQAEVESQPAAAIDTDRDDKVKSLISEWADDDDDDDDDNDEDENGVSAAAKEEL